MSHIAHRKPRKKTEVNPLKRHYAKPTRKSAIFAFCAHCMGCTATEQGNGYTDHMERNYAKAIRQCSAPSCPLYRFRPFQVKA